MCIGSSPVDDKSLSENKNTHTQTWDKMTITLGMQIESLSRFSISQWEKDIYSPSLKPKNTEKQLLRAENKQRKTLIPTHCALVLVGKNTQLEQFKWKQNRCISRTSIHRLQVEICAGRTKIHWTIHLNIVFMNEHSIIIITLNYYHSMFNPDYIMNIVFMNVWWILHLYHIIDEYM